MFVDPALAVPLPAGPVFVDPVSAVPPGVAPAGVVSAGVVSVGLVLAPPEEGGLDVDDAGVEELLPGAGEDPVAPGLVVPGGLAGDVEHGGSVAVADVLPPFALALAVAEAAEVAVLVAVEVALAVAVAVAVAVALSPGLLLVPPLGGLLAGSGDALGAADWVGAAVAEADGEPGAHAVAGAPLWTVEVPP